MFNVPARIYPFVLLIILQLLIPGISFLGHLSGILVGIGISIGAVSLLLPSQESLQKIESFSLLTRMINQPNYIKVTSKTFVATTSSGASMGATVYSGIAYIVTHLCNFLGLVGHIIGCPIDRISDSCLKCWTSMTTTIKSIIASICLFFSQLFSRRTNEYTPLSTTESIQV